MKPDNVEQIVKRPYPIELHARTEPEGDHYWIAALRDFGHSCCSASGDTVHEALRNLRNVQREVVGYFLETGKPIPEPSTMEIDRSWNCRHCPKA